MLLAGVDPLRIYIHEEGLARFATEEYEKPNNKNLEDMCMHLTNYAINKNNSKFIFAEDEDDEDVGHKWTLSALMSWLEEEGHDVDRLWLRIEDIIIKTLCVAQPSLAHTYRSC